MWTDVRITMCHTIVELTKKCRKFWQNHHINLNIDKNVAFYSRIIWLIRWWEPNLEIYLCWSCLFRLYHHVVLSFSPDTKLWLHQGAWNSKATGLTWLFWPLISHVNWLIWTVDFRSTAGDVPLGRGWMNSTDDTFFTSHLQSESLGHVQWCTISRLEEMPCQFFSDVDERERGERRRSSVIL
jgi:hypothetical protein